jgi:large repetitive protein
MRSWLVKSVRQVMAKSPARKPRRQSRLGKVVEELESRSVPSVVAQSNPRPVAVDDWTDTDGSTPVNVAVLANDYAAPPLSGGSPTTLMPGTVHIASAPAHGHAKVQADGSITFTGTGLFTGSTTFKYTVRDSAGVNSLPATVTVRVNRPVAGDDWTDTDAGNPVTFDVLANDADPDGNSHIQQPGSVTIISQGAHGHAVADPNTNLVTFTPDEGFGGTDSFRYTVTDDAGATSVPATVFVRVNRPTAGDDLATFNGATPVDISVLDNDTDPDGNDHIQQVGSVALISQPTHGSAIIVPGTNIVRYTADASFSGTDSFKYTVTDDAGATSVPAVVTVAGTKPQGANDDLTDTDGTTRVNIDVLANDSASYNGRQFVAGSVRIASNPKHGSVSVNRSTGEITYRASSQFEGTDTFRYQITYGVDTIQYGTVSVRVNRPTAADDWTDTDAGSPVTFSVLDNDTDPDGNDHIQQPGSVKILSQPTHGHVTVDPSTNDVTFKPAPGFAGTFSFKYRVLDDAGAFSLPATVFVRVNRPTANADEAVADGPSPVLIDVLANDTDPDGHDHITFPGSLTILSQPKHGHVAIDTDVNPNQISYVPNPGFVGTDTFRYFVTDDAQAASPPATVTVLVEAPVATHGTVKVTGSSGLLSLAGPTIVGGVPVSPLAMTITIVKAPVHGHLAIDQSGDTVTYTPDPGFTRDRIVYTLTDASGAVSAPAEVDLIV